MRISTRIAMLTLVLLSLEELARAENWLQGQVLKITTAQTSWQPVRRFGS